MKSPMGLTVSPKTAQKNETMEISVNRYWTKLTFGRKKANI